ncbi:dienelactone hydrolase [Rhizobium sp. BK529]|uniref:dienelactone hydrolase family protein n=1 Tax=unclassified Rhizobium TaxID=2613769 RepID=UPI0010444920|nr:MULTISPECIES: dienelactone hydrolase family protein [unclassified Rhizobium]MBB3592143.1 dienelactone hydrolase [Rhizobium sp. BK529]TCS06565.1 dienelactone hydrolase [Rhizobium sp. BK418]
MAAIALFHSVYGLRSLERDTAARLRAAGHHVVTPDLYGGRVGRTLEEGFALKKEIGWAELCRRAEMAVADLPASAVLGGFSMGAGVAASLWPGRPQAAGILLLHGIAEIPTNAREGIPLQVHLAEPDEFTPADEVTPWRAHAARANIGLEMFLYPGVGHLYTDPSLPDYEAKASEATWSRVDAFLAAL